MDWADFYKQQASKESVMLQSALNAFLAETGPWLEPETYQSLLDTSRRLDAVSNNLNLAIRQYRGKKDVRPATGAAGRP